jgi:hypothetical protein
MAYSAGLPADFALPADFDPEAHKAVSEADATAGILDGVSMLSDFYVVKNVPGPDTITCWHCYTADGGANYWCVEVDCPWPPPEKVKTE